MTSILAPLRYTLHFFVFLITNIYGTFAYLMWTLALLPLRFLWPPLYWKIDSFFIVGLQSVITFWFGAGGYGVVESGDDISKLSDQEVLLLPNHQCTADVPLVMVALWGKGNIMANAFWIMDWIFTFTNFGLFSTIRKDFFIKKGKELRELQMVLLKEHLQQCYLPMKRRWIVLFPEGGFLRKRLAGSHSFAKKHGYPMLYNVALPKIGALKTIVDTIGAQNYSKPEEISGLANGHCNSEDPNRPLKWLVDMTIGYRNGEGAAPDLLGMCLGYREKQDMYVHYRAFPLSKVPRDHDGLLKWMFDRYEEKEQQLDYFKIHGCFPADSVGGLLPSMPTRKVTYDWGHVFLYQVFFIVSTYLYYTCLIQPVWSMVCG